MPIKAIIFDMDGTIANTNKNRTALSLANPIIDDYTELMTIFS